MNWSFPGTQIWEVILENGVCKGPKKGERSNFEGVTLNEYCWPVTCNGQVGGDESEAGAQKLLSQDKRLGFPS